MDHHPTTPARQGASQPADPLYEGDIRDAMPLELAQFTGIAVRFRYCRIVTRDGKEFHAWLPTDDREHGRSRRVVTPDEIDALLADYDAVCDLSRAKQIVEIAPVVPAPKPLDPQAIWPHRAREPRGPVAGWVYLVGAEEIGYCKIGYSARPDIRFGQLTAALPFRVRLLHKIATTDCVWAEAELHARYAHTRVNGEWFRLADDEIAAFRALDRLDPAEAPR